MEQQLWEVDVLGPLVVRTHRCVAGAQCRQSRQVLALLSEPISGSTCSLGAIERELWDDSPPGGPAGVVQTYVKQLRRALVRRAGAVRRARREDAVLRRAAHGLPVRAAVGPIWTVRSSRQLSAAGSGRWPGVSPRRLRRCWTGRWRCGAGRCWPTCGRAVLESEVRRLDEVRRGALERRTSAYLLLGRHAELIGELSVLTAHHPAAAEPARPC